ncbi:MAG: 6-bladed beta-propeller [Acidobacteriota bacterium]|nr:6-bladed beta-propeller [Acidobacteriota bacterium]
MESPFIPQTDIYVSLAGFHFAVAADQTSFILDRQEKRILRFDADGKPLPAIGGEGSGPGEFLSVDQLDLTDEGLFVSDVMRRKISQFTLGGKFLDRVSAPFSCFNLITPARRVDNGWIFVTRKSKALVQANHDFSEMSLIAGEADLENLDPRRGLDYLRKSREEKFNPTYPRILFARSAEGLIVYSQPWKGFRIVVYDPKTRQQIRVIERPFEPVPVPRAWAEAAFEKRHESLKKRYPNATLTLDMPAHFPAIMNLSIDYADRLAIRTARQFLGKGISSDLYDLYGNPLGKASAPVIENRVLGCRENWCYIAGRNDDELQVWRVRKNGVEAFLKAVP